MQKHRCARDARRDAKAAKRFFRKVLKASHSSNPRVINVDKNAAYPPAVADVKQENILPESCELCHIKYLNNIIEQDHRFIKRRVAPSLGFASFQTANRTLRGYEEMNMIRKGQITKIEKGDITGQMRFIENLFGTAAKKPDLNTITGPSGIFCNRADFIATGLVPIV